MVKCALIVLLLVMTFPMALGLLIFMPKSVYVRVTSQRGNHFKHGHTSNGVWTATYRSWYSLKQRCNNPKYARYENYGGRGIKVCERWVNSFVNFLEDMGERPEGTSIDRIDNDGNYEPSNCRWATTREQYDAYLVRVSKVRILDDYHSTILYC